MRSTCLQLGRCWPGRVEGKEQQKQRGTWKENVRAVLAGTRKRSINKNRKRKYLMHLSCQEDEWVFSSNKKKKQERGGKGKERRTREDSVKSNKKGKSYKEEAIQ